MYMELLTVEVLFLLQVKFVERTGSHGTKRFGALIHGMIWGW